MTTFGKLIMSLVLILIGTGIFYGVASYVEKDNKTPSPDITMTPVATTTENDNLDATSTNQNASSTISSKKIPFAEFLSKGGIYRCTVTQLIADTTSTGTVYTHDERLRVDLTASVLGKPIQMSTIIKDGYVYSWTNTTGGKGQKTKIASPATSGTTTLVWDSTQVGDYSCEPWNADDTVFDLPPSITFK